MTEEALERKKVNNDQKNPDPVIVDLPYTPMTFLMDANLFMWTTKMQEILSLETFRVIHI